MSNLAAGKYFYNNKIYALGLMTLSLGFFKLNSYSFSIANFLVIYLFFYYLNSNKKAVFSVFFSLIVYLIFIAVLFIQSIDFIEYLKSFILTSVMLLVFISSLVKPIYPNKLKLSYVLSIIVVLIVLFECIQVFEYSILGTSYTWFLLDKFSISTATDVGRFQAVNFLTFMRPISFFHEPSYLGIVLLILLICANELQVNKYFISLYYIGIILSFSTTALAFLVLYIIFNNFNKLKNFVINHKKK